jgi:predicted DNA-binding protein
MEDKMSTQMIIRIEPGLKDHAGQLAKQEGKNLSQLVRELLIKYIKERDMSAHIDDLWDRIGSQLSSKAATLSDIEKAVQDVRQKTI